ncbi:MAG: ABC transporter permease subunit [Thermoplasmata archaeon]
MAGAVPLVAFVVLFALGPVGALFARAWAAGGGGPGLAIALWGTAINRRALENSLLQGGLSAALATALGYPAGVFLGRHRVPGGEFWRALLLVPFLLSSLVVAFGIADLFGPAGLMGATPLRWFGGGVPAIVAANLVFNTPLVILFTAAGCESAPPVVEEAAATLGASPARRWRDVWGPPSLAGAAAGGVYTFLFSALAFTAPIVLCGPRCYTLEAQVYALNTVYLDPTGAGLLALGAFLVAIPPIAAVLLLSRRGSATILLSLGAGRPRRPLRGGGPWPWVLAGEAIAVSAGIFSVLAAVLFRTVVPADGGPPGAPWRELFGPAAQAAMGIPVAQVVANTLGLAALAAAIALLLTLAGTLAVRDRPAAAAPLGAVLIAPLLISPVLLAFGLAQAWRPILGGAPSVWIVIALAQATLAIPFAWQALSLAAGGLSRAPADAARSLGADRWTAFWDADAPRLRSGIRTALLFAFAIGLGEFTATYFLWVPQFTTLSVAAYLLGHLRFSDASAGATGLLALVSLVLFAAIALAGREGRPDA